MRSREFPKIVRRIVTAIVEGVRPSKGAGSRSLSQDVKKALANCVVVEVSTTTPVSGTATVVARYRAWAPEQRCQLQGRETWERGRIESVTVDGLSSSRRRSDVELTVEFLLPVG